MDLVAPLGPMYQAGTLSGNPLAMAAGLATLRYLKAHPELYQRIEIFSAKLVSGVLAAAKNAGVAMTANRVGSMFTWFFTAGPVHDWIRPQNAILRLSGQIFSRDARQRRLSPARAV